MPALETKLDQTTIVEWHKHSQGSKEVPDYIELLDFLDFWSRAAENTVEGSEHRCPVVN